MTLSMLLGTPLEPDLSGHVLIVAIPDLRNQNAPDPLRPRVDLDTLTQMAELAKAHAGPQLGAQGVGQRGVVLE